MESGQSKSEDSVAKSGEARNALDAIDAAVAEINDMNAQIASAAEEQGTVADDVNQKVVSINQLSEKTKESSDKVLDANERLVTLASDLQSMTDRFAL